MKKIIQAILLTILITPSLQAEPRGRGLDVDRIAEELKLSDEQLSSVKQIFNEQKEQMRSLASDGGRPDRSQMKSLRKETQQKLAAVLNEDQLARLEELKPERRGRR